MRTLLRQSLRSGRQRWHNRSGRSRVAFLVGCGRSGTSMVVLQLGRSWRVDVHNEDNQAAFAEWRLRELEHIDRLVARSWAPLVLFKPILETHRSRALLDHFPEARLLFSFRHYDDVVNSSLKKFGQADRIDHINSWVADDFAEFEDARPPEAAQAQIRALWRPDLTAEEGAALYWLLLNRLYFDLNLAKNGRSLLVGYESMVSGPISEMKATCDFLGLIYEPRMTAGIFASSVRREPRPALNSDIRQACEEMWERLCEQAEQEKLKRKTQNVKRKA